MISNCDFKEKFILYESVGSYYLRLVAMGKHELAESYMKAIINYGLYSVIPDEDDDVWITNLESDFASINNAKQTYNKKINIKKDDLRRYIEEGITQKEIAEIYNCSVDTIKRRTKEFGLSKRDNNRDFHDNGNKVAEMVQENGKDVAVHEECEDEASNLNSNNNINNNKNENVNVNETTTFMFRSF